jgi:phosphate/sulfate permease
MNSNDNNPLLIIASWTNAFIGTMLFSEPILSSLAYIGSIIGSGVYIYTSLKKHKNEKNSK